jgi:O-antigen/teichoic acid export membrane protein
VMDESTTGASSQKAYRESLELSDHSVVANQGILTAAKGGGIAFAGMLFAYSARFVLSIVVARMIGAEQWGLYALGFTLITTLSTMALLGLPAGVVRFVPIANRQDDEAHLWGIIQVSIILPTLISLIFAGTVFLLAEPISQRGFHEPRLTPILRLISLGIPLLALTKVNSSITRGFKKIQYEVYADNVIQYLVKLPLTLVLLFIGLDAMGVVIAHIAASAVAVGLLIHFVHNLFPLNRSISLTRHSFSELLPFSLPVCFAEVVETLGTSLGTLLLGSLGMTFGVGVYAAALRLSIVGTMFYLSIGAISEPVISDLFSQSAYNRLEQFYQTTARWLTMVNLPIFMTFVLFAESLLSIFGNDFTAGETGLIILAFGPLASASTGLCGKVINMTGYTKLAFVNSSFFLFFTVVFSLLLIPHLGVTGAALATTLSIVIRNAMQMLEVYYLQRILPFSRSLLKPIAAGLIAAGVTLLIKTRVVSSSSIVQFVVGVAFLWGTYLLFLLLLKVSEEDRLVLEQVRARLNFKNLAKS